VSLASRAGDLFYTFRFIKLLVEPWEETDAFKLGIIDKDGKRIKGKKIQSDEEKDAYSTFRKLVYNVKRVINLAPGGNTKIASYATALFLLKEHYGVSDKNVLKILKETGLENSDTLVEKNEWFLLDDDQLAPGVYRVRRENLLSESLDDVVYEHDKVKIMNDSFPIGQVLGVNIYKGLHMRTNKDVYVTAGEIYR
jgi:hypothetical protein